MLPQKSKQGHLQMGSRRVWTVLGKAGPVWAAPAKRRGVRREEKSHSSWVPGDISASTASAFPPAGPHSCVPLSGGKHFSAPCASQEQPVHHLEGTEMLPQGWEQGHCLFSPRTKVRFCSWLSRSCVTMPCTNLPDPSPVLQPLPAAAQKSSTKEEAQSIKGFNAKPCQNKQPAHGHGRLFCLISIPILVFRAQTR